MYRGGCLKSCCKDWTITIDPAKEILSHLQFDAKQDAYVVQLDEKLFCPFLTEDSLCRLQRDYGEEFLSVTCSTYPRRTYAVGKIFERSLTLTCPAAAETVLFAKEPLKFEFVEVPEKIHGKHGRIDITKFPINNNDAELVPKIQSAMISILQLRRLPLNQRLIILGFFVDKLQELVSGRTDAETFLDLIAAYQSEEFLLTEILPVVETFVFDANDFIKFIITTPKRDANSSSHFKRFSA